MSRKGRWLALMSRLAPQEGKRRSRVVYCSISVPISRTSAEETTKMC